MNWGVLRKEWGAVTFVLTVLLGVIIVPLALYLTNTGPTPVAVPVIATPSAVSSSAHLASPTPAASTAR